ncbi:cytochrome c553 [Vibrio ichthyoenteri ATCC 700023]|uniref:Cytochrome c553 n=1 Tax=Vibrio ichthyoenteri ATCC 700023 TaxID=870968 RepID=F9S7D2_9VIBR|nr:cytochrome c [Vibrio ichthyoenteri]EGU31546.1 cytochrome c553 [Vibrio ichthyoenteri ATCC 700023]
MKKIVLFSLSFLAPLSIAQSAYAEPFGDAKLGKIKSPSCVFCHGQTGKASNPSYPNLNGQNAAYLYQSMLDYQQGKRTGGMAQMMGAQLRNLNEQDLKDIAAFYAEQP